MKRWMIFLLIVAFVGCDIDDDYEEHKHYNHVLLLQIEHETYEFEGGIELGLHSPLDESTVIPIDVEYKAPEDFGYLKLSYQPLNEEIFYGTIAKNGTGYRKFPKLVYANYFTRLEGAVAYPGDERFQIIHPEEGVEFDFNKLWDSIADVKIVNEYLQSGKNIGVFLYQRNEDEGNPEEWSWYVVMNR